MFKKITTLLIIFVMIASIFTGCGAKNEVNVDQEDKENAINNTNENQGGNKEEVKEEVNNAQKLRFILSAEPEVLDPSLAADSAASSIIMHTFEGLVSLDENDQAIPGVAESWEISDDGLTYTFHLRNDAKWSDNKTVTAHDFEYAWKRVLDPEIASDYAYMVLPYIKNAEKYYNGEATEDELGIKVIDEKTIEVTIENPTSYMLELFAFWTYYPVRKDIVEQQENDWYKNPATYICNGPFKMNEWNNGEGIGLLKNEDYWQNSKVKLEEIYFSFLEEQSTALNAMEAGDVDGIDSVPSSEIPRLSVESPEFVIAPKLQSIYIEVNNNIKPVDDPKVRKALSYALDRKNIVELVLQGGQTVSTGVVPYGVKVGGNDFREAGGDYGIKPMAQVEEARKLLAEAGYPNGEGFPKLTFLFYTKEINKKMAEAIQQMWKENLNIDIELENKEFKIFIKDLKSLDYQIARGGWTGDYLHPMTFLDLFISTSGNNTANWANKEYDEYIALAQKELDSNKAIEYLHKAEDLLMEDMVVIPLYYSTQPMMMAEYVKGWSKSPLGYYKFDRAYIEK